MCSLSNAQNVDYESRITSFFGDCNEFGTEEYTWNGWLSDNVNTVETYSGCITRDNNGAVTQTGAYATRSRNNVASTQLRARIDAWENDSGNRCNFDAGNFFSNGDDCRLQRTSTFNFTNPLEYQSTTATSLVGNGDFNMNVFRRYHYSTTSLSDATEYATTAFTTGGNRPFWGSRGAWASIGDDCATSGTITHNQTSSFSTTVSCQRQVTFRWRVSSQANSDFLEVFVNGVRRNRISGITGWQTITINLDNGNNTVEWRYVKDGSVSSGDDRGFVDNISFNSATVINPGAVVGNQTVGCDGNPSNLANSSVAESYSNTLNYQWQISVNNTTWANILGATNTSYNPPAGITQRTYYRRRAQDGCGFTGYSNTLTVDITREYVYDGSWCPNDPNDISNPSTATDDVYVRSNLNQSNGFTAGTLTVNAGVTMNLLGSNSIEVHDNLFLNGTLNLNDEGQLVQPVASSVTRGAQGRLQITRYGNPSQYRYTYWGSPVSNFGSGSNTGFSVSTVMKDGTTAVPRTMSFTPQAVRDGAPGNVTTAATISGRWLYTFRDLTNNYSNWEFINPTDPVLTAQGYTMKGTGTSGSNQTYIFEGTPNNGDITLPMSPGNSYLISNPYPSAIDAHQFLLDNPHLDGTLYFWEHYGGDSHNLADYQGGYALYNFSGGIGAPSLAVPSNGVSGLGTATKTPARYVPVAQGFFVTSTASGSLSFNNDMRFFAPEVDGTSVFVKSNNGSRNALPSLIDTRTKLRVGMTTPQMGHRQLLLTVDPNASISVDKYYDGELFDYFANDFAFDLNNKNYGIQGIPNISNTTVVPLVVDVVQNGLYEFNLDQLENWNNGLSIYLYDNQNAAYYDITNSSLSLNLNAGHFVDRFSIRFENTTLSTAIVSNIHKEQFVVFQIPNQNQLIIKAAETTSSLDQVAVYDLHGRVIIRETITPSERSNGSWTIDSSQLTSGYYIVYLKNHQNQYSYKVLLRQY